MDCSIPFAASEAQAQRILKRLSDNLLANGYQLSQNFVYQIIYFHEGALVSDTVGEASFRNKEIILSRRSDEYLIGTYSRGLTWGKPMIAYAKDIEAVTVFKSG